MIIKYKQIKTHLYNNVKKTIYITIDHISAVPHDEYYNSWLVLPLMVSTTTHDECYNSWLVLPLMLSTTTHG